jgi:hypothetical protein
MQEERRMKSSGVHGRMAERRGPPATTALSACTRWTAAASRDISRYQSGALAFSGAGDLVRLVQACQNRRAGAPRSSPLYRRAAASAKSPNASGGRREPWFLTGPTWGRLDVQDPSRAERPLHLLVEGGEPVGRIGGIGQVEPFRPRCGAVADQIS